MYFAFINSRISYGIEVYGHCADEHLNKLQTLQNELLKLMLKLDRRTSTNQLHRNLSLLKVSDIHTVSVLCFVNNRRAARCPGTFCNYYQVRQTERELLNKDHLDVPWARTDMGLSSCYIKGARLWNENFPAVNPHLYKKCFKTRVTKYFIEKYVWWSCKILQTPDVSRLYIVQQCTIITKKTSVKFALTNDTACLALTGELWGVFHDIYTK